MEKIELEVGKEVASFFASLSQANKQRITEILSQLIEKSIVENNIAQFKGILSTEEGEELQKLVTESRNEWDSRFQK